MMPLYSTQGKKRDSVSKFFKKLSKYYSFPQGFWSLTPTLSTSTLPAGGYSDQYGSSLVSHLPLSGGSYVDLWLVLGPRQVKAVCSHVAHISPTKYFYFLSNDDDEIVILQYGYSLSICCVPGIVHALSFNLHSNLMEDVYFIRILQIRKLRLSESLGVITNKW